MHDRLVQKLEELHLRVVEADAFYSAAEAIFDDTASSADAPVQQQARNRLSCFNGELRKRIEALLHMSQEAVDLAMKQSR